MKLDDLKKLHQKKYRQELGYFLIEGEHLILELEKAALIYPRLKDSEVFVTESKSAVAPSLKKTLLTEKQLQQISETKSPQGLVAAVPIHFREAIDLNHQKNLKAIYLHEVQDPGNLGTIVRSLSWFGNFRLLLSPNSVDPFNGKVIRSSMGAIFHTPIQQEVSIEDLLKEFKSFACLDMQGKGIEHASFKQKDCYVFGNEARGISADLIEKLNAERFTIKGGGAIDSLNLASALNICVYELGR